MNSSMSGWSTSRMTILAARRVLPPGLLGPGGGAGPRVRETGPEAGPPAVSRSFEERSRERLMPEPEPPLKIFPSVRYHSRMESMESSMERMKQAEHWGFSSMPRLNQTGEVKQAFWVTRMCLSSARAGAESPGAAAASSLRGPRKYLEATTLVAFWDQEAGNSTSFCSKTGMPSAPAMRAVRSDSHWSS